MLPHVEKRETNRAQLSPAAFRFLANLVYVRTRIVLGPEKQPLVIARLTRRRRQLNLATWEEYCEYLRHDRGEELQRVIDLISTHHTGFFREPDHFTFLRDTFLPPWMKQRRATDELCVWSAACSSGEEAYSIAMTLAAFFAQAGEARWRLEASDISTAMIEIARRAIYPAHKVTLPHRGWLPAFFQKGTGDQDGHFRVRSALQSRMRFHRINLFDPEYPFATRFQVIFCRNVMMYFDRASQEELVGKLVAQLALGGCLIVGHSESLLGMNPALRPVQPGVYQRHR